MAPVIAGLCRFESLKDGTLDLSDLALMNDALSVKNDNEQLMRDWQEGQKDG